MGFQGVRRPKKPTRGGMIAALDVGSTSVVCCIARVMDAGALRVVGLGHQVSEGVRAGAIVDMEAAQTCIGAAVHAAEQMAGETIHSVIITMSGGRPASALMSSEVQIHGAEVSHADLRRAMTQARGIHIPPEHAVLHAIPVGHTLDGREVDQPLGMVGDRLGLVMNMVTAHQGAVRNLKTCVSRCHLEVEGVVTSPYASALACMIEDEIALGSTLIDMGGGTTTISIFRNGHLVGVDHVPVGGQHVTADLAVGLGTTLAEAERLKTLYGNTMPGVADDRELLDVRTIGSEHRPHGEAMPKSMLVRIIRPRMEEIFEMVRAQLTQSGYAKLAGRKVVLTGGASQLTGAAELARKMLDKQIRPGRPTRVSGLADSHGGPAYAAIAGALLHALHVPEEAPVAVVEPQGGLFSRVGSWLREYL